MLVDAIQEQTYRRKQRQRRRRLRKLKRFNLKFLFLLTTIAAILFAIGPPIFRQIQSRIEIARQANARQQNTIINMKRRRPVSDEYRNEKVLTTNNDLVLRGECHIDGKWYRYWTHGTGSGPADLLIPLQ